MAKTMATIIGLAMAATTIGVNISQYPIVWQMVDPAWAANVEASDIAPVDAETDVPAAVESPAASFASHNETTLSIETAKSVKSIGDVVPIENRAESPPSMANDSAIADDPQSFDAWEESPPIVDSPLVPVNFAGVSRGGKSVRSVVHRLPPVTPTGTSANVCAIGAPDGSIPLYPSTGLE